ncbi:MAG: hypothetical protein QJR09_03225 [Micrococcus sp.]|nr:hypothetical protein [Micrococcus sp.]
MRTLTMDLPADWISHPVEGFHLVAAGPVTGTGEGAAADAAEPSTELAPNIIATTYSGEPVGLCGLTRLYVVEDVTCTVAGYPARRMDLTRWTGQHNLFTRRWLLQEALPEGPATLEISASCLISDYERLTTVFDAVAASARFTDRPSMPAVPARSPRTAPLRAVA